MSSLSWLIDWLVLTACQPVWGSFIPRGKGITFIIHLYLHFCVFVSVEFFAHGYMISNISNINILHTLLWFQVSLSCTYTSMVSSNYFYLIIVICLHTVIWIQVTYDNNHKKIIIASNNYS